MNGVIRVISATHNIKLHQNYADLKVTGQKTFEIRLNDRDYNKFDKVIYQAVDDNGNPIDHPINNMIFMITHVSNYMMKEGWVVFADKMVGDISSESSESKKIIFEDDSENNLIS